MEANLFFLLEDSVLLVPIELSVDRSDSFEEIQLSKYPLLGGNCLYILTDYLVV